MKLHLPVGLRTALLAALASFSVAFGQITVKQSITEESEGSDVEVTDGTLNDTTLQGDVLIEVNGTDGDATLSLSGDISQDATTTITVGEGGEIKTTERLTIGTAGSNQGDPGKESVTTINVNGGKFDASKESSLIIGRGDGQDSVSMTTINVSNNGSFILGKSCAIGETYRRNSHSETVINVTSGGTFRNIRGYIGDAGWSTAAGSPLTATTVNTITVEGNGSRFIDTGYGVGRAVANALEARTTINVKNGGTYTTRPDDSEHYGYASGNLAIASSKGNAVVLTINLEDGNFLFDGDIAYAANDNTSSEATITLSGESHFEITGSVSTGGGIGAGSWQSPESTVSINVQAGSTFTIASSSYNGLGYVTGSTTDATIKVGIEIDDGTFEITGSNHAFIGTINADEWSSPSGEAEVKISVHGSEKGKGKFNMETGELSWKGMSTESHTTLDVDLTGYAEMTITGGKIGGDEGEATIDLYDNATLTLTTPNENISEHLVVTLHGGNLGEGFTGNGVSIDTAEGFTGAIDLGGIEAGKITSIKINSGDIAIVDIGAGTLTLDAEDILTVGKQSAWDGEEASTAPEGKQALLQFKTAGSGAPSEECTVGVNGKVTLNFDGQYLAEQKGKDGTVTLRVWITNGKLAGEEEGSEAWAKEHFTIGTGWNLDVTSYNADQGMLILEGTSTVWVATVDGGEGTDHAEANASELGKYTKVIVDEGTTFTADGDATIKQLEGQNGSKLDLVKREGIESATITLENVDKEGAPGTGNTVFESSITAGKGVNLRKEGDAIFTVQGTLQAGGNVDVAAGELVLEGADNTVAGVLSIGADGKLQVKQALTLSGESDLTAGTLTGEGKITVEEGGSLTVGEEVTLGKDLSLQVDGDLTLHGKHVRDSSEDGTITGSGTLTVAEGGELSIEADSEWTLEVSDVHVAGTLSQKKSPITAENIVVQADGNYNLVNGAISALGGADDEPGTLDLQVSGTFMMSDGTIAEKGDVAIDVKQGGAFTMSNGYVAKGGKADITIGKEGEMTVDGPGAIGTAGDSGNSETTITVNGGSFVLGSGTNQSSIGNAGSFDNPHESLVDITVTDGGSFTMGGNGQIGVISGDGDEGRTTINVNSGTFDVKVSGNGIGTVLSASQAGVTSESHVTITVSGDGAFTLSKADPDGLSGGMIGCAQPSYGGAGKAFVETKLIVKDTGSFTMSSGNLGGREVDSDLLTSELTIELRDQGQMQISGGKIGEGATVEISDAAKFTLDATEEDATNNLSIMMHGGSLAGEGIANLQGTVAIDTAEGFTGAIDLGGLDASRITQEFTRKVQNADTGEYTSETVKGFRIREADTHITGLQAGTMLTLSGQDGVDGYHNSIMVGNSSAWMGNDTAIPAGKSALIEFQDGEEKGKIHFTEGSKFFLDFSKDGELVGKLHEGQVKVNIQVYFTNGELTFGSEDVKSGDVKDYFALGAGWGLQVKEYTMTPNGGLLTITGDMSNVAVLDGEESKMDDLKDKEAVVVIDDTILDSTDGGKLEHLTGDGDLTITGAGEVMLENNPDEFGLGETTFRGKLTTDSGINLHKTGSENLTLSGGLEAKGGLAVDEGGLVLAGKENTNTVGGTLTVGGEGTSGTLDVQGNLDAKDVDVQNGKLTLSGENNTIGGDLTLGEKGALRVDGKLTLSGTGDLSGAGDRLSGGGTIVVDDGGSLTLKSDMLTDEGSPSIDARDGSKLVFAHETVDLGKLPEDMKCTVAGDFTSTGDNTTFAGSVVGTLTVEGGSLNMSNTENSGCDLCVVGKDTQATIAAGSKYNSITVGDNDHDNDKLIVTAAAEGNKAGAGIQVTEDIVFRKGSETDFTINLSDPNLWGSDKHDATMLSTTKTIYIEPGTKFVIDGIEETLLSARENLRDVVILHGATIKNEDYKPSGTNSIRLFALVRTDEAVAPLAEGDQEVVRADVALGFTLNQLYENVSLWMTDNGDVVFNADRRTDSKYASYAKTANGKAGLNLLWQNYSKNNGNVSPEEQAIMQELERLSGSHNAAEASRVMAAVAGSTLTSVSAAQSAALRNQTSRVRDHALQAARLRCQGNDEATQQQRPCKTTHVWVEGTSFFSEQHSTGDESGYRLNSWGGAVGIDAQVNAHWSVGLSLAANYGDLEARAADYAKGDLDSYYVSAWSQAKNGRWGNTLLFTVGTNEADLRRTVNYGAGSYTATSNASGSSLGAMWELTCDFHPVKENKSNILQPLFNVAVQHTSMDGFSEKNAGNVGLATEKQTRDTMTLGLGLRWLAAIDSAKAVNRTVSTELHANVAQDLGDRRSVANVALLTDPNFTQSVYGSKTGSTAFQFGAGVNVPMTPNSCIYVNAGGELREHANTWNATLGVRMGF